MAEGQAKLSLLCDFNSTISLFSKLNTVYLDLVHDNTVDLPQKRFDGEIYTFLVAWLQSTSNNSKDILIGMETSRCCTMTEKG